MRYRYIPILFIATIFFISCSSQDDSDTHSETQKETPVEHTDSVEVYTVKGTIKSLPPNGKFIIIHHEKIPGFMNAMEMPFHVESPDLVKDVSPGDSISFTFEATNGRMTVTEINQTE